MSYKFKLPDVGEGLTEAEIISWLVAEGDDVKADDSLVEIQNDKSTMEIPSPVSGRVEKILVPEGIALVDQVIIEIATDDTVASDESSEPEQAEVAVEEASDTKKAVSSTGKVKAVPSVRRYARQQGVDLSSVTPTGNGGKIVKADIDAFLAGGGSGATPAVETQVAAAPVASAAPKPAPAPKPGEGDWREKMTPVRKAIAKAMVQSRTEIPHVTVFDKVNATNLMAHRAKYKEIAKEEEVRLTYLPYIVKAMVQLLKEFPSLNAYVDMAEGDIVHKGGIHIGIATNTDHGLYVPVIKDADKKSVFEIAKEITELGDKAAAGKLTPADMSGSSATITNIGGMPDSGGVWSTPIINYPESFIMGIARIADEVIVNKDREMEIAPIMRLSFAFDHRLVDGVEAQEALGVFKKALADPDLMLLKN